MPPPPVHSPHRGRAAPIAGPAIILAPPGYPDRPFRTAANTAEHRRTRLAHYPPLCPAVGSNAA